jgi:hypothetical protein
MSALGVVLRILGQVIKHPSTQKLANHAIRLATAELVRHIQKKTRGRKTTISYS